MEKDVLEETDSESEEFLDALEEVVEKSGLRNDETGKKGHHEGNDTIKNQNELTDKNHIDNIVNEVVESAKNLNVQEDPLTASQDAEPENLEVSDCEGSVPESDEEKCGADKNIAIEEERLKERDSKLTDDEKQELKNRAQELKAEGNDYFKKENFVAAIVSYTDALQTCPLCFVKERSIMYSNRAACKLHLEQKDEAIEDCSKALELHPHYLKCLRRRAELYEKTEKLDEALADFQNLLEKDPSDYFVRGTCMRLEEKIKERNENLKEEMMGKLKDLGNLVLRPFGLSTENFQLNQNEGGGYSVSFQQNTNNGK